jgi:glycosyltransferase involved in cell wall biosynthesis
MNKKIAFIDHSFHKKTNSSKFFIKLLKTRYEVDVYYDTYWKDKKIFDFEKLNFFDYKAVIFWQVNYNIKYLKKLKCKNIIFIPMYDDVMLNTITLFYWKQFRNVKFITFSKTLHKYLMQKKLNSFYLSYFPAYQRTLVTFNKNNLVAFFWYRVNTINWNIIKKMIDKNTFHTIYIQNNPDPNQKKLIVSEKDIKEYNIKFINWFENKKEYLKFLKKIDIYFAPRKYEGIGLSFLEAMSYGKFIVANNEPTMNEYIIHNKNGFLYDLDKIEKINLNNISKDNINEINMSLYRKWMDSKGKVFDFIESKYKQNNKFISYINYYFDKLFRFPFKIWNRITK